MLERPQFIAAMYNHRYSTVFIVLVEALVLVTVVQSSPAKDLAVVCDRLTAGFNSINDILPMVIPFESGHSELGDSYPAGTIYLDSESKKLKNCYSYQHSAAVIVHLEVVDNINITFPKYPVNGKLPAVNMRVNDCHVVLMYSILHVKQTNGTVLLKLKTISAEIKELGSVSIEPNTAEAYSDLTRDAEDLVRPPLGDALRRLTEKELSWVVDPNSYKYSTDGFEAFKTLFKGTMLRVDKEFP